MKGPQSEIRVERQDNRLFAVAFMMPTHYTIPHIAEYLEPGSSMANRLPDGSFMARSNRLTK
jgi:hypothetical protein